MKTFRTPLLIAYCVSLNFDSLSIFRDLTFTPPKLIAIFYFLSILSAGPTTELHANKKPFFALVGFYGILLASTLLLSNDPLIFAPKLLAILLNIMLLWALLRHNMLDPTALYKGIIAASLTTGLTGIAVLADYGVEVDSDARVTMFGENTNIFGTRLAIASAALLCIALERPNLKPILFISACGLAAACAIATLKTGSRVSTLSVAASTLVIFATWRNLTPRKFLTMAAIGIAGVQALAFLEDTTAIRRWQRTITEGHISGRDLIWEDLTRSLLDSPIFGSGLSVLKSRFSSFTSPHNVPLEVYLTTGIVGSILFAYFLLFVYSSAWRAARKFQWKLPLVLAIPLTGQLLSGQVIDSKILYLLQAYILTFNTVLRSSQTSPPLLRPEIQLPRNSKALRSQASRSKGVPAPK
jgi:O-antigen ligase